MKTNSNTAVFAVDSNVHIEVLSPQNIIRQSVDKHNRATKHMLEGLLSFLRGDFNTSYRQQNESKLRYKHSAKNYIPCYINFGTGGVIIDDETGLPVYNTELSINGIAKKTPVVDENWNLPTNYVSTSDTSLVNEISKGSRVEISILSTDNKEYEDNIDTDLINSLMQYVFSAKAETGHCSIYGASNDSVITEVGLFASPAPNTKDLLARVILKNDDILCVRPQDTVIVTWVISIIALNDQSIYENDESINLVDSLVTNNVESSITFDDDVESYNNE